MTRITILVFFTCILTQLPWAVAEPNQNPYSEFEPAQINEEWRAVRTNLHATLSFRAAVVQRMLEEANWVAGALKLPTRHPIQITDIQNAYILPPFSCILPGTNLLYDIRIPREQRLRALKFGPNGWIATTNFQFYFREGRLWQVMRLSRPNVEYLADSLDTLVSKPSLIDTNGAYQLATQWLAAVDMNMAAVSQLKWTVNQLHYKIRGATNYIALPLFYVDFGNKHHSANGNLPAFDEPLISVEVLGTSKELQNLIINDLSLSRRRGRCRAASCG